MFHLCIELSELIEIEIFTPKYESSLLLPSPNLSPLSCQNITGSAKLYRQAYTDEINPKQVEFLPTQRTQLICITSVPLSIKDFSLYLTSLQSDFIQECMESLSYLRTIYASPYFSTVLLYFNTQSAADNFYMIFNGREFEESSHEYCYVLFLSSVTYFSCSSPKSTLTEYKELPMCPLCIERLDVGTSGITGVLRTEVQNLKKTRWVQAISHCEVCKILEHSEEFACEQCGEAEELWTCLICANIGCGRYKKAHGKEHFLNTSHSLTVEIISQCVWDYEADNYVHRLLHSGKGVLVLDTEFNQIPKENVERMITEYNHLISSQLEQQRIMFEQKIENVLASRSSLLHEEIKAKKVENEFLKKKLNKIKTQRRKKEVKEGQLANLKEEIAILQEVQKSLIEYSPEQSDLPIFEDKKSKGIYLKLQRLRGEFSSIMETFQ